jgi:hypothetical protein
MTSTGEGSVLRTRGLRRQYGKGEALVRAVDGVSLDIAAGETVAAMGRAAAGSPRCCTCSAAWTGPRAARSGWPGRTWAGWANGGWPGCGATPSGSCSRPST